MTVLIIGAGLGGLTAGIALAQRGFEVELFEQAARLQEVGAGLTVSHSAQRAFASIGVLDDVLQRASITPRMAFLHYRDGRLLAGDIDHSDGGWSPGAPSGGIHMHRADLHAILAHRFLALRPRSLHLNHRLTAIETRSGVTARFENGEAVSGDILIGADGVRSAVRQHLSGEEAPRFTGQIAYRFMLPGDTGRPWLERGGRAAVYLGPGKTFNRYSLRGGAVVNCVGIAQTGEWCDEGWSTPATSAEMLDLFAGWDEDVLGLIAAAPEGALIKWGLFDRPPLERWGEGAISVIGDAAHPMLPFLGLGAAMAIEDGLVLARALEREPGQAGLRRYEAARSDRACRVAELSRVQGEISQERDPDCYDPSTAPAHDPALQDYDPATVELA